MTERLSSSSSSIGIYGDSQVVLVEIDIKNVDSVHGLGRSPGEGHDNPLQYSCLENLHGQRSLMGYRP